ncbi:sulfite exporter TauE/SafE family protein [Phycicoccus sp. M110.8]|uniref:sulfite exporter TauE/SafE family protein n=1 Tax=Phycicoccus sp. M110.8 TaxID=3075433 RepID=UPI0028FD288D|nr:sulfite exporter TauE/SafE family protein [Phycicoccus sp. M110.8]MDU0315654.1 sulfite exporter TauE/SafE family protein [Phycicoccus sp. M110.8]HET8767867.1 sulfite exporter TauE/SafE family protein [Pedococcus sp.]
MSAFEALGILLAGMAAGTINTVVGSGTLVTFPTLLFFGYPPVVANVSNTVGLVAGGITGVHGYRHELRGAGATLRRLAPASFVGGVVGAVLLLVLPAKAFQAIVPVLILLGLVLVVLGPRLQARALARHEAGIPPAPWHGAALVGGTFVAGVYGGYFGAAQGVILMGIMSALSTDPIQRLNGYKNVLATIVNAVAAITFMLVAWDRISWPAALLVGVGAFAGGIIGARVGRRLPPLVLRSFIVLVGVVGIVKIVWFS